MLIENAHGISKSHKPLNGSTDGEGVRILLLSSSIGLSVGIVDNGTRVLKSTSNGLSSGVVSLSADISVVSMMLILPSIKEGTPSLVIENGLSLLVVVVVVVSGMVSNGLLEMMSGGRIGGMCRLNEKLMAPSSFVNSERSLELLLLSAALLLL